MRKRFIILFLCFLQFACAAPAFRRIERLQPGGMKLAVLAGINNELSLLAAQDMTVALKDRTVFDVIPAARIGKVIPAYPVNIRGPYRFAYLGIEPEYENTDREKLKVFSQKLGADYLLIIWAPSAYSVTGNYGQQAYQMEFITQLFEFPEGKEVGHGLFGAAAGDPSGCFAPPPQPKDIREQINETMGNVAESIGKTTGTARRR